MLISIILVLCLLALRKINVIQFRSYFLGFLLCKSFLRTPTKCGTVLQLSMAFSVAAITSISQNKSAIITIISTPIHMLIE